MTDDNPEGNAQRDAWDTSAAPGWQAALIRLARPALLWALGFVTMGLGAVLVGVVEAVSPGAGVRMASAMAALLRAYPMELYILVAFLFGGQVFASTLKAWKGGA
ncbi:MAG: hypothetical protein EOP58_00725 [Sphingomonadales bacterium]|nr:MAG: hypothetical protein EOP58_00725 [Sphingomonadales bacterium]